MQQFSFWPKHRHSSMDAGIQPQGREAPNLQQGSSWSEVCHPWTLDSGFPAGMTGLISTPVFKMRIAGLGKINLAFAVLKDRIAKALSDWRIRQTAFPRRRKCY